MNSVFVVTGGAGFIGSHLVERLLREHPDGIVRVLDDFSTGSEANLPFAAAAGRRLEIVRGDVKRLDDVERAVAGAAVVFHQAAMRSVPRSVADPLGANANNVDGTLHVLEAARRQSVPRVVYASSSSVYGANPELPKREDQTPAPISPYAVSRRPASSTRRCGRACTAWRRWACGTSTSSARARTRSRSTRP